MAIKKDYQVIQLERTKLYLSIIILVVLGCCILIRMTPLVHYFWVNFITAMIVKNGVCLFVISVLLIALYFIEVQKFKELLVKEGVNNGD